MTIRTEKKVHGVVKYIYCHVWNEPGSVGGPKKIIVSTWNHGMPVDDHARKGGWKMLPQPVYGGFD